MKRIQKRMLFLALLIIVCLLAGCLPVAWVASYSDAERYQVGNFTYSAKDVDSVYVHWYEGEVQFVESKNEQLKVYESGEDLPAAAQMHWYLNDGELRIEFCEANYAEPIASVKKHLVVELPAGIDLIVNDASADIIFGSHSFGEVAIYSISGRITLESLTAEKADIGTISGKLQLGEIIAQKKVRFVTTSGPIDVQTLSAKDMELSSVSGSVTVNSLTSTQNVNLQTTSGTITINTLVTNEAEILSGSGAVKMGVSRGKKVNVTTSGGAVEITLQNLGATVEGTLTKNNVKKPYTLTNGKYVIGNGTCKIKLATSGGEVTVQ